MCHEKRRVTSLTRANRLPRMQDWIGSAATMVVGLAGRLASWLARTDELARWTAPSTGSVGLPCRHVFPTGAEPQPAPTVNQVPVLPTGANDLTPPFPRLVSPRERAQDTSADYTCHTAPCSRNSPLYTGGTGELLGKNKDWNLLTYDEAQAAYALGFDEAAWEEGSSRPSFAFSHGKIFPTRTEVLRRSTLDDMPVPLLCPCPRPPTHIPQTPQSQPRPAPTLSRHCRLDAAASSCLRGLPGTRVLRGDLELRVEPKLPAPAQAAHRLAKGARSLAQREGQFTQGKQ